MPQRLRLIALAGVLLLGPLAAAADTAPTDAASAAAAEVVAVAGLGQQPAPGQGPESELEQAPEAAPAPTVFDELLVSGEQPGPGLWRVAKQTAEGEHVLWILGSYGPLPKRMQWRSRQFERAIAESAEVIAPASVNTDVGVFRGATLLPSLVGIRKNPNGETLQELVPPELYERWLVLKRRYLGNDRGVEKWRPVFAAGELYREAIGEAGLELSNVVWPVVEKAAKKRKLVITRPVVDVEVEEPRDLIREFKKAELEDLECFARTIERLESDLDLMRVRANAWATGEVGVLRELAPVDQAGACLAVVTGSELLQSRGLADLPSRLTAAWLAAAEEALARNASTVAVVWMSQLLREDGLLAQFEARGYRVEAP
ncbi:MAG: TraB/GumN family protein [Steroidobacteraceae bacterium]|nr:TraB/GumN family protein [Steroidobacteraceae bacterium]